MIYQSVGGHLRQNKESYVFLFKVDDAFQDRFSIKLSKINHDHSLIYKKSNELHRRNWWSLDLELPAKKLDTEEILRSTEFFLILKLI